MTSTRSVRLLRFFFIAACLLGASAVSAGIHTWDVNEVFSNADGTIQFVELRETAGGAGEINVGNGSISSLSTGHIFNFGQGQVAGPTSNKFYLLATPGFAALSGAPTPDAIMPSGIVPFFNSAGDTVSFASFDSWAFGAVPTDGTDSLERISGVGPNSPTNYAGVTGSVNAGPPPVAVPSMSHPALWLVVALILGSSLTIILRKRLVT